MDDVTRLRRQFRKAAAEPMAHLLLRDGLYHYSRRVPAAVRATDPSIPQAIRRSTGTDRLREAQAIVREWAAIDEAGWLEVLRGGSQGPWIQSLKAERELTLDKARDVIESRADALHVRSDLEAASSPHEFPVELRSDPIARPAVQAVYAAHGKHMTWAEAWEAIEPRSGLALKTRAAYGSAVKQFDKADLPGPYDITRDRVRAFLRDRAQTVTRSTVTVYCAAATAILTDLFDDDVERTEIFRRHNLRFAKKAANRDPLTREDIRALIGTGKLTHVIGLLMRLSLGTGGRRQEVYSGVYNLPQRTLIVPPSLSKTNSSARAIPLAGRLMTAAEDWVELRASGKLPSVKSLADSFAAIRDAAGLPATKTLHSCRHAFLTELARSGVPADRRKVLAGHSSSGDVHSGYVHLDTEDLRADVETVDFETGLTWP